MLMQNLAFPEQVDRENNKDYNQVLLDVQRSLRRFPPGELIPVQSSVFVKSYYSLDHITKPNLHSLFYIHVKLFYSQSKMGIYYCFV